MKQTVTINLIRHGQTEGNLKKRYIGVTDETLCWDGIMELMDRNYPRADAWFVSPMKRCLETAELIGMEPEDTQIIVRNFRECDFGIFENKNHMELSDCEEYQRWIDSNATMPFPDGEAVEAFKDRCCRAFEEMLDKIFREKWCEVNVIVHGGTIMSIMEKYAAEKKEYYQWHVENGCGYILTLEEEQWKKEKQLQTFRELQFAEDE